MKDFLWARAVATLKATGGCHYNPSLAVVFPTDPRPITGRAHSHCPVSATPDRQVDPQLVTAESKHAWCALQIAVNHFILSTRAKLQGSSAHPQLPGKAASGISSQTITISVVFTEHQMRFQYGNLHKLLEAGK